MKSSKSLTCGDLSFKCVDGSGPSLGFIVSKKYGGAIQRNLFKRRCRSVFRLIMIKGGSKLSIIVRPKSQNIPYDSIYNSFSIVYEKLSD